MGPDGLSRRPAYAGDDEYSNPDLDEEDPGGPPTVVIHDPDEPQPLDIKDFVHEIDTPDWLHAGSGRGCNRF